MKSTKLITLRSRAALVLTGGGIAIGKQLTVYQQV